MALKKGYFLIGIMFTFIFGFKLVSAITNSASYIEALIWGAFTYMCFALSYLFPHFQKKDERMNLIRQKGLYYSFFALMIYLFIAIALIKIGIIALTSLEIASVLISLMVITMWTSWIILSKRY
ncbi:hypothetical protein M3592_24620 [Priestia aryabhattai]|uniref:hypothetical protein n=1 Tax=Priestia TaxID=2800373 RepID=UPI00203D2ADC|nr:hypothetical protein [Priestia aryabhattai]MCM2978642.1 hypothetical protein [Priestia aryabhattai]